jgi:L-serine deaminase
MQRVDANADEDWKAMFERCLVEVARKQPELTSDDVLAKVEALPDAPTTHNLSAIGPVMRRAASDGILSSTNRVTRSARAVKHGIRHTVWHSNLYRKDAA